MKCQRCSQSAVYVVDVLLGPASIPLWGVRVCVECLDEIADEGEILAAVTIDPYDLAHRSEER